ncbi:unnamed protein product [Boreogadus saida]
MLDYACWKINLAAWKSLKAAIIKLKQQNVDNWKDVVGDSMASRRDWWPAFHFTHFHAKEDLTTDQALLKVKAWVCRLLFPDKVYIVEWLSLKKTLPQKDPLPQKEPLPQMEPLHLEKTLPLKKTLPLMETLPLKENDPEKKKES